MSPLLLMCSVMVTLTLPRAHAQNIRGLDLRSRSIPAASLRRSREAAVTSEAQEEHTVRVDGATISYRRAEAWSGAPSRDGGGAQSGRKTLFLLHGAAFNADTWNGFRGRRIDTMQKLSSAGFDVIAVNLPGYSGQGRTTSGRPSTNRADFIANLVGALVPGGRVVIVSPSFSGSYAIPFLIKYPGLVCGFVPVAPGAAGGFPDGDYPDSVPTMAVVGQRDSHSSTDKIVRAIDNSQKEVIPRGGHPAYLDDPDLWHKLLFNFMSAVDCNVG